ncbi:unnamed protein product [Vitrella brassicaformis CCMP3155]|uniref:Cell division control protein 73 C-terminal domain-containing protein n=3 Tax=Vitrella brassicaformis TaxID=1169539 RepID=A0A0G4GI06_VITBC|nr:unnamed protein product [Vitrella brassicaformis CCMP3155]|eukprot:CEM29357.1 unnamed protein product [Vitrella brassicaformis CCMP3155]
MDVGCDRVDPLWLLKECWERDQPFQYDQSTHTVQFPSQGRQVPADVPSGFLDRNNGIIKLGVLAIYLKADRDSLSSVEYQRIHSSCFPAEDRCRQLDRILDWFNGSEEGGNLEAVDRAVQPQPMDQHAAPPHDPNTLRLPALPALRQGAMRRMRLRHGIAPKELPGVPPSLRPSFADEDDAEDGGVLPDGTVAVEDILSKERSILSRNTMLTVETRYDLKDKYDRIRQRDKIGLKAAAAARPADAVNNDVAREDAADMGREDGRREAEGAGAPGGKRPVDNGANDENSVDAKRQKTSSSANDVSSGSAPQPASSLAVQETLLQELVRRAARDKKQPLIVTPPTGLKNQQPLMARATLLVLLKDGVYMPEDKAEEVVRTMAERIDPQDVNKAAKWYDLTDKEARERLTWTIRRTFDGQELFFYVLPNSQNLNNLTPLEWRYVTAVFVGPKTWQFIPYPVKASDAAHVFTLYRGFYMKHESEKLPPPISQWNVEVLNLRATSKHETMFVKERFWSVLEAFLRKPRDRVLYNWSRWESRSKAQDKPKSPDKAARQP